MPTEKPTSPTSPMDEHPLTEVGGSPWAKSGAEKGRNLFGTVTDDFIVVVKKNGGLLELILHWIC